MAEERRMKRAEKLSLPPTAIIFGGVFGQRKLSGVAGVPSFFSFGVYVEVNMDSKALVWPLFNSLQAFWSGLQCPLQVGTVACRYYVMRYMCEIVSKDTNIITDAIDTRNSYSQLELDEVRVEWAEFLARYI
uniref:Uncharacterized protein n=1 Tax=Cucumis melo TaxID=3656 RepID=A0A9I9EEQ8_CUCME